MSKYSIIEYRPEWVTKFQGIKKMLEGVFGDKALTIEHVGSTSIPGMEAKPIIDVLVIVEKVGDALEVKEKLIQIGYQYQENYIAPNTLLFRKIDEQENKLENIHVCENGSPKQKNFLVMRDYLRTFPKEAEEYSSLKEELVKKFPDNYESYRAAKDPFLKTLEQKAYQWKVKLEKQTD